MRLSALYYGSLAFLPSFIAALAVPDVVPRNETLAKRGGEVNYLTYCLRANVNNMADAYHASYIAWYSNIDNTQSGNPATGLLGKDDSKAYTSLTLGLLSKRISKPGLKTDPSGPGLVGFNVPLIGSGSIATGYVMGLHLYLGDSDNITPTKLLIVGPATGAYR
ncbi:hypothetical protein FRC00_012272 [Tulasnella sp. 408]|nr:hypothetical protein FRC00_012272 [Tulasnella sp. 408]